MASSIKLIITLSIVAIIGLIGWYKFDDGANFDTQISSEYEWHVLQPSPEFEKQFEAALVDPHIVFGDKNLSQLDAMVIGRVTPIWAMEHTHGIGVRHQWPAVYAIARFSGEKISLVFDDSVNRYRITIDEDVGSALVVDRPGGKAVEITGLGPGVHSIRLDKISESFDKTGDFLGFFVTLGNDMPPTRQKERQIEFIGDSDTVGYGNVSSRRECSGRDVHLLTDTQLAFGPLVARHFQADYQIMAVSGSGVVRNAGGVDPGNTMVDRYNRLLEEDETTELAESWSPQVVAFALGSNDFSTPLGAEEAWPDQEALSIDFVARYVQFANRVRLRYPGALIIFFVFEGYGSEYLDAHQQVLNVLRANGDEKVAMVNLPKIEKLGCHWHPSQKDHHLMADKIIQFMQMQPAVW
ncbi:SGNH/GDSL hydrolase family protein [Ruegeria halocynthiae]|uniref:SGNH/GDSL hydrolase family protein n=1 Tax=Ruegeria halocynthiae TaxID=985054 RepID=UPI00115FE080|nr:SGNH/GDSL hydrolase family protein [Ruegeria halocynthiae]